MTRQSLIVMMLTILMMRVRAIPFYWCDKLGLRHRGSDDFVQLEYTDADDCVDNGFHAKVNATLRAQDEETLSEDEETSSEDKLRDEREESNSDIRLSPDEGVWEIRCKVSQFHHCTFILVLSNIPR